MGEYTLFLFFPPRSGFVQQIIQADSKRPLPLNSTVRRKDMSDSESSLRHLRWLSAFAARIAPSELAIYRHDYHMLVMGSFTLEVGTRKERRKFTWDGREGFLDLFGATCPDSRTTSQWQHILNLRLEFCAEEPYQTIEKLIHVEFRVEPITGANAG